MTTPSAAAPQDPPRAAAGRAPAPAAPARAPRAAGARRSPSEALFAGAREVQIAHRGSLYRLKQTALGKLILTK